MTKRKKIILAISMVVVLLGLSVLGWYLSIIISRKKHDYDFNDLNKTVSKVVLFIGDGMGENHVKLTSTYYDKPMYMTSLGISGHITTYSNAIAFPTDSAAAGSALATGRKYDNGEVARHKGKDIESISELAKKNGLGVAVVTTDSLTGATPASFSSHANNRGDSDDIIKGQLSSNIDLFLGSGKDAYLPYKTSFEERGYTFSTDYADLSLTSDKIISTYSSVVSTAGTSTAPTLEMLTTFAIDYMEHKYPSGYFIMIEGAHIDKRSHSNKVFEMMEYLNSFDSSIKIAHEKLKTQNVAIMVTADHETGGLKYTSDKNSITNNLYTRTGHSDKNVPYYIYLNPSKKLEQEKIFPSVMDNTDIFKISKHLLIGKA